MLTPGHIAYSWIVIEIYAKLVRTKFHLSNIVFIIVMGNILDFDFVIAQILGLTGGNHHAWITHTPLFGILLFILLFILLRNKFSNTVWVLACFVFFSHFLLDDMGYWLSLIDSKPTLPPQIDWFYPLASSHAWFPQENSNLTILHSYFFTSVFYVEILFLIVATSLLAYRLFLNRRK